MPRGLVKVFVLPPSVAALEARFCARTRDGDRLGAARIAKSAAETSHWPEHGYVIVNRGIEASVSRAQAIGTAERLRRIRQVGLANFVKRLRAG